MPGRLLILSILVVVWSGPSYGAENWPQFRGPLGNATADDANPPTKWSPTENIVWKADLPGRGASSPVVWDDRIFLTAYTGYGIDEEEPGDKTDLKLHTICLDKKQGKILWNQSISANANTQNFSRRVADHGYATATPATDGEIVVSFFGVSGLVAYDLDGNQLWQQAVGDKTAGFGSASSPVVFEDLVYVNASIESGTLFAFDKKTGKEAWSFSPINRAWTSPCLAKTPDGKYELVVSQKDAILGFDPKTGKQLWTCAGVDDYVVPVPVSHEGVIYCLGGRTNRSIAVKLGGRGDVTKTHQLWKANIGANVTSPVYYKGHLYWASDKAIANCLNAETGESLYRERLPTRARIYASIVRAGKHLYITTRDQGVVVLG
ncbi:MAG: PQQ-binding-like beta-propeller repeat protein, partial [Planctomycetaceae bacterium]|nr:PQQ-binding-like beta-propeller repeat protein [Planctomycetaceae bacterium]